MTINLSICIPTYNNALVLDNWFKSHQFIISKYNIPVFISDNASTDSTALVTEHWSKKLNSIHYSLVPSFLKAEANFERAINLPGNGWAWLLGDSYLIDCKSLDIVLSTLSLNKKNRLCLVNIRGRIKEPSNNIMHHDKALEKLSAPASCISCMIFNLDLLGNIEFKSKESSFYPHLIFFFESILNDIHFSWIQDAKVSMLKLENKRSNWANTPKIWEIAVDSWYDTINNLQGYSIQSKATALVAFGKVSGLFSLRGLILLRAQGFLSKDLIKNRKFKLKKVLGARFFTLPFILLIPVAPLRKFLKMINILLPININ